MNSIVYHLFEVNVLLLFLFMGLMVVKNKLTYRQRSLSIAAIPLISLAVVALKATVVIPIHFGVSIPVLELEPVIVQGGSTIEVVNTIAGITDWFVTIYFIMVLVFGLHSAYKIVRLGLFFGRNKSVKSKGYHIYSVSGKSSFSFFNRIQLTPTLDQYEREIVLEHEQWHAKKYHSLDLLILEVFHVLFWFNPLFFLMKRELVSLHEFEVDALMFKKHKVNYMKFLVNYAFDSSSNYLLTSRFYNRLTIKKRIKIMKTRTQTKRLFLMIIPMIALAFGSVRCAKENSVDEKRVEAPSKVYDEVDQEPEFKGGQDAMFLYLQNELKYPKSAIDEGLSGIVYVEFVIAKDGAVKDVELKKGVASVLDNEALRVIENMPNWIPGKHNGANVAVRYTLPINFLLN